jgi:multidrug efflux system outer membrane protein
LGAQTALLAATKDAYDLSELRYRNGVANYLTVLDSQRSLYSAEQSLITLKLSRLQNLVTLYKALGGGWNESTQPLPTAASASTTTNP